MSSEMLTIKKYKIIFRKKEKRMRIIIDEYGQRILIKEDGNYVNVGDGMYVQYTGIHYASESSRTIVDSDPYWYENTLMIDMKSVERKFI